MRIDLTRTGGVTGMRKALTIDSGSLSPEEAEKVRALVESANFFNLPAEIPGAAAGADQFLYIITVAAKGREHTVQTSETSADRSLRPLLDWLIEASR